MTELAAQLLESPKAPQIIQQVQAILNDEQTRRRAFYEWMDEEMKAEFINGEIVVHSRLFIGITPLLCCSVRC